MFDQIFNNSTLGVLERTMNFTEQRHQLLLNDIANASTPGFVQQDVSPKEFEQSLQQALDAQRQQFNAPLSPQSTSAVVFDPQSNAVALKAQSVLASPAFHDGGARSMETLMTQLADNAEVHNMTAQFLRSYYGRLTTAVQLRV